MTELALSSPTFVVCFVPCPRPSISPSPQTHLTPARASFSAMSTMSDTNAQPNFQRDLHIILNRSEADFASRWRRLLDLSRVENPRLADQMLRLIDYFMFLRRERRPTTERQASSIESIHEACVATGSHIPTTIGGT